MPLDPYASCPCGSGKKFKWCCVAYFAQVEKAFEQERLGQHDAALTTIKALTTGHADQPAVWGYYAQFLYNAAGNAPTPAESEKLVEQAEEALSEALKRNPNFGMAHFLRGMFRQNEGELIGALLLFRKAAETYDPEATDQLAHVYELIFRNELLLNRPVAARAALERSVRYQPDDPEAKQHFEALFGAESRLPECARKAYTLRPTAKKVPDSAATGRFSDARAAFEELTRVTAGDPAAWFNLGLVYAWTGEQPKAAEALGKSIELETDDHRAEEAAALLEVLRCGQGMENDADYLEHGFFLQIRDPQPVMQWLQGMEQARRLLGVQVDQEQGVVSAMVVEELPSLLAVGSTTLAKVVAKLTIGQGVIRVWHPNRDNSARVVEELRTRVNLAVQEPAATTTPINFGDVVIDALVYPTQTQDVQQAEEKLRGHAKHYFEEEWLHRPLKSLAGNTPLDAVGSSLLRKRVFGVVKFVADCFAGVVPQKRVGNQTVPIDVYDFAELRHKLGLEYVSAAPPHVDVPVEAPKPVAPVVPAAPAKRSITDMNAGELAAIDVAALSVGELDQAMRAALKLDARDLAVAFAQAGVTKPHDPAHADRYPLYAAAVTGATAAGEFDKAQELLSQGERFDAEHNGGSRAVEFGLKKAQLYVKAKDADKAAAAFEALIAGHPAEGKFYTTAAEEMLRLKAGAKALGFAERGLAAARTSGNRDLEGHCQELVAAAKKVG
ncbi:tetratricopeptide repeat protein [Urbifossiella limnaea]|uniref:Tetratricopeptide repeat protein n=1 Tax=Urbifossiella limnaea TaxID=2528023 RepID=A0A517XVV2_9BACT|nr:tetratricopeptide repeat protein [Urbifossiella limnaea]QDU21641.1 Tetratricopeptide repeat protein [Urbifossiella limnaea]